MKNRFQALKRVLSLIMVFAMVIGFVPAVASAAGETVTVYFRNDWLWPSVQVHYWGGTSAGTTWPGANMTKVDTVATPDGNRDVYAIEIPADVDGFLFSGIENGGSNRQQTPDIKTGLAHENAYTIHWDGSNKVKLIDYAPKYNVTVSVPDMVKTAGAAKAT